MIYSQLNVFLRILIVVHPSINCLNLKLLILIDEKLAILEISNKQFTKHFKIRQKTEKKIYKI